MQYLRSFYDRLSNEFRGFTMGCGPGKIENFHRAMAIFQANRTYRSIDESMGFIWIFVDRKRYDAFFSFHKFHRLIGFPKGFPWDEASPKKASLQDGTPRWEVGATHGATVTYVRPYFLGISSFIGLKNRPCIYGRYLQFRFLKWPLTIVYI